MNLSLKIVSLIALVMSVHAVAIPERDGERSQAVMALSNALTRYPVAKRSPFGCSQPAARAVATVVPSNICHSF